MKKALPLLPIFIVDPITGEENGPSRSGSGRFVRGPIPIPWLRRAMATTHAGLKTALVIWFLSGLNRGARFRLEPARCSELGLDRKAKQRGLKALENAGLIRVVRRKGASPMITILDGEVCERTSHRQALHSGDHGIERQLQRG